MSNYRKIYTKRNFLTGRDLWMLGEDHLLIVKNRGYTEDYRRFFFADIQWIKISPVGIPVLMTLFLGLLFLGLFTVTMVLLWEKEHILATIFGFFTVAWLILIAVNYLLGPPGLVTIKTFTEKETLPVGRFRKSLKTVNKIRAAVNNAQGGPFDEKMLAALAEEEKKSGITVSI